MIVARTHGVLLRAALTFSTMKYWIGKRLRLFRREKELKQSILGSVAGMCQSDVSRMENGELDPGFHSVMAMLQVMGRKLSEVVDDEGRPVPKRE